MSSKAHMLLTASALALTALLASCGVTSSPRATAATSADAVMTVLEPGVLSDAQLEATYGGTLVTRTPTFALLTVSADAGVMTAQGSKTRIEKNRKVYRVSQGHGQTSVSGSGTVGLWGNGTIGLWGNGTIGLWGNGTIGLWGNGTIGLWGNGTIGLWGNGTIGLWGNGRYEPIPQNSDPWQQIALDDVQAGRRASGNGMTVAVIDTGVDLNHPALAGGFTEPSTWHDFVDGDATPQDEGELGHGLTGHGTEVAGIVAQVAPAAKVMPLRVLGPDGTGDVASVAAAIVWAVDHGADVINLSLGSDQAMTAVSQAIAYANSQGVVVAAAAGNTGAEGIDYPAAEFAAQPMNVAVGSVDLHDVKSAFSQYGALELLAPGEAIYGPAPQERSAAWSGTSMSAPVVAGGLALALEGGATGAQAAAALTGTATSVDGVQGNAAYAGKLGAGRIDLNAALTSLGR